MGMEGNRQSGKQWKGKGGEEVDKQIGGQGIGSDTHISLALTRWSWLAWLDNWGIAKPITLSMKNAPCWLIFSSISKLDWDFQKINFTLCVLLGRYDFEYEYVKHNCTSLWLHSVFDVLASLQLYFTLVFHFVFVYLSYVWFVWNRERQRERFISGVWLVAVTVPRLHLS